MEVTSTLFQDVVEALPQPLREEVRKLNLTQIGESPLEKPVRARIVGKLRDKEKILFYLYHAYNAKAALFCRRLQADETEHYLALKKAHERYALEIKKHFEELVRSRLSIRPIYEITIYSGWSIGIRINPGNN